MAVLGLLAVSGGGGPFAFRVDMHVLPFVASVMEEPAGVLSIIFNQLEELLPKLDDLTNTLTSMLPIIWISKR